jgi:hypothetical protein
VEQNGIYFKKLIYSAKLLLYYALQVAGEMVWRQTGLEETTQLFSKPPENHRQCPAGGFSFLVAPSALAGLGPGGPGCADWERMSLHKITVHGKRPT